MMRRSVSRLLLVAAISALPAVAVAKPARRIAVVDVRKAMESTTHWKQAYAKLEKEKNARQALIEAKKAELKQKKEAFEAKKAVSDPKAIAGEEEALYREANMFMRQFQMSQQELTYIEKMLADEMLKRLEVVVRQLSAQQDYDYVFETGFEDEPNVLYAKKGIDITPRVTKAYAELFKGKPLEMPKVPQGPG